MNELVKFCFDFDYCGNFNKDLGFNGKIFDLFMVKSIKGWWVCFKLDVENLVELMVSVIYV